ncbi:NifU family protein [Enterobacteriaceae endosymbiont of Neohaemonia nigricornis]|uniref:NifU family protein n=1 Tax=Enterobacteriaceae endosymbiont of Neohaemonia nigricornis TaxID=2675792 RepID=UPI001448C819|nr:NifU family protein [Enterobacteriaceae endosymbiont of Neohaemonia nigricornis]QJC30412.1 hypothetical protein GJT85_01110 [Enterobacteriaceae endosymbiont of Neohaemonia nigricornis]
MNNVTNITDDIHQDLQNKVILYITQNINPKLLYHGGSLKLIKITKEKIALLKFNGGCKGCAMSQQTLHNWIEKQLLNEFPILQGIRDITIHKKNNLSYF